MFAQSGAASTAQLSKTVLMLASLVSVLGFLSALG
jgi:hypothetical protein